MELFVSAFSRQFPAARFNVIRPGYTFGDPVAAGASMENDKRFKNICGLAKQGKPIEVNAGDGTQFIWAGHLAKLYKAVLSSAERNEVFYGLSRIFVTWEEVASEAVKLCGSGSRIIVKGRAGKPHLFCMDKIRKHFGLSFDPRPKLREHLQYLLEHA